MRALSFAALTAAFTARNPTSGQVDSISASAEAEAGTVQTIEAMAVRGFTTPAGKLQWVRARENFLVAGEVIPVDDLIEVPEADANRMRTNGQVDFATDDEVKLAQDQAAVAADKAKA